MSKLTNFYSFVNGLRASLQGEIPDYTATIKALPHRLKHIPPRALKRETTINHRSNLRQGTQLNDGVMACHGQRFVPSDALKTDMMYPEMAGFHEPDCPDHLAMICQCDMDEDIKLELSPHPYSIRQAVNLVIAVKRFRHIKEISSGKFCEEDVLLSFILENVIEERHEKQFNVTPIYYKSSRTLQCTVCDKYKKSLVKSNKLANEDLHLKAVTLSAGNLQYKVQFSMSTYSSSTSPNNGQPVCLGISNSNLYIACTQSGGSPVLILKEVNSPLNTIKAGDPNEYDSLLFFRKTTGTANNTFESVKYPGWFITTAFDDWKRVEMHQAPTDGITSFTLEDPKEIQS